MDAIGSQLMVIKHVEVITLCKSWCVKGKVRIVSETDRFPQKASMKQVG
jgi:hypothetical protein